MDDRYVVEFCGSAIYAGSKKQCEQFVKHHLIESECIIPEKMLLDAMCGVGDKEDLI